MEKFPKNSDIAQEGPGFPGYINDGFFDKWLIIYRLFLTLCSFALYGILY